MRNSALLAAYGNDEQLQLARWQLTFLSDREGADIRPGIVGAVMGNQFDREVTIADNAFSSSQEHRSFGVEIFVDDDVHQELTAVYGHSPRRPFEEVQGLGGHEELDGCVWRDAKEPVAVQHYESASRAAVKLAISAPSRRLGLPAVNGER
jgi:hypothetical protein